MDINENDGTDLGSRDPGRMGKTERVRDRTEGVRGRKEGVREG